MEGNVISDKARSDPGKPAIIMGESGQVTTYSELERRSNQIAHLLRASGLRAGDAVAICLRNCPDYFEIAWGALRAGLVVVPVSCLLTASEIEYIAKDSGAKILFSCPSIGDAFFALPGLLAGVRLYDVSGRTEHFLPLADALAQQPETPIADESMGSQMLYSSGTTGRPKGILWSSNPGRPSGAQSDRVAGQLSVDAHSIYLSPAPLYHSAPFKTTLSVLCAGGTAVIMEKFDAELALKLIEAHRINTSQWVPTHFVRLLKLPEETRRRYDLSSLKMAIHAAAPCPVPVKRAMIDWLGPIVFEYFGSTEQTILTTITSQEWLRKPGSVGKAAAANLHICDDDGVPVPAGTIGTVYVEGGQSFRYHNSIDKTASSRNSFGWTTVGDIGFLDEDGYLFLTDRKNFTIISGGVNIYPQEIENLLVTHPKITDAAVIGTPDDEMGEIVTAVIQPASMADANSDFAEELKQWMRLSLSGAKVPRRIEFQQDLPRLPTGKMQKFALRERYSKVIPPA